MSFLDLVQRVETQLIEQGVPLAEEQIFVGPEHLARKNAPPRIVVDPIGTTPVPPLVSPTLQPGHYGADTHLEFFEQRDEYINWHLWGLDYATTLELHRLVAAAMKRVARGAYHSQPGKWTRRASYLQLGRELVFGCIVHVPLPFDPYLAVRPGIRGVGSTILDPGTGAGSVGCSST